MSEDNTGQVSTARAGRREEEEWPESRLPEDYWPKIPSFIGIKHVEALEIVRKFEHAIEQKVWRTENPERHKTARKAWEAENSVKLEQQRKVWRNENRDKLAAIDKRYRTNNREKVASTKRLYWENNTQKIYTAQQSWRKNNPEKVKISQARADKKRNARPDVKEARRARRKAQYPFRTPEQKFEVYLRTRVYNAMKGNWRSGSAVRDLGCSIIELKAHIESLFEPGMSWENWGQGAGKWHVDHVQPLASFDLSNPEEFLKAVNWKNLQPLWSHHNLSKAGKLDWIKPESADNDNNQEAKAAYSGNKS